MIDMTIPGVWTREQAMVQVLCIEDVMTNVVRGIVVLWNAVAWDKESSSLILQKQ